jgi:hypothetical protein
MMQSRRNYGTIIQATFREGGIERLIKDGILIPLEFSNLDYCIDCIKGKYAKQVKKSEAK